MFEPGALLLVPFPFTDLSASKRRPVLALTRPDDLGDFIALPVTSRAQDHHGVPLRQADLVQGSLPLASWVRTDRVVTLNAEIVVKSFGRASARLIKTALDRLCAYVEGRAR